jgi:hypothetical protein
VDFDEFNAQHQTPIVWEPSFAVVGAHFDQAARTEALDAKTEAKVASEIAKAQKLAAKGENDSAADQLTNAARRIGADNALTQALLDLADSLRG